MNEENKSSEIISWDELENVETTETQLVLLPSVSKALGRDVHVKVRAIDAQELLVCANFPLDEMMQIAEKADGDVDAEVYEAAYREHVKAFDAADLWNMVEGVVKTGMVEPTPSEGNIEKIRADWPVIYKAVLSMTLPKEEVDAAGAFRSDG